MANTYTQLYYHVVFVVQGRKNLINPEWKDDLYKYITGITNNKKQTLMIINGMPDHVHILMGSTPDTNLSHVLRDIKANSSRLINSKKWVEGRFEWQKGFGAFTVGYSQVEVVAKYIENQEKHHKKKSFNEEYISFLDQSGIAYNPKYIFEKVE